MQALGELAAAEYDSVTVAMHGDVPREWRQLPRAEIQADIMAAGAAHLLVRLMHHRSTGVQTAAIDVLTELMRGSEPNKADIVAAGAVPVLARLLGQDGRQHLDARYAAEDALRKLVAGSGVPIKEAVVAGGAVPALVQALGRHGELFLAVHAKETLRSLAAGGQPMQVAIAAAAPALVQLLTSQRHDGIQRLCAAQVLLSLTACRGSPPAIGLLNDPVAAAAAVPALVQALSSDGRHERAAAAAVLSNMASSSEPSPAAALAGLSQAPALSAGAATKLVQLLHDSRSIVQQAAAAILRNLAAGSKPGKAIVVAAGATQALEQLRQHSDAGVRSTAEAALYYIQGPPSFTKGMTCR